MLISDKSKKLIQSMTGIMLRLTGTWQGWLWLGLVAACLKIIYLIPVHPNDLRRDPASDPAQYISLAEQVSRHVFEQPLSFGSKLISGTITPQQLVEAGLDVESVQNVFRAPTWITLIGIGIRVFGYSDGLIRVITVLLFAGSSVLLYGWFRQYLSPGWALAGWGVFCVYPPFYFMSESALVENMLVFQVILYFFFLCRLLRSWDRWNALWTGLTLYGLVIAKPFFYAWGWPVLIGMIISVGLKHGRSGWKIVLGLVAGMMILLIPFKLVVFRTAGNWDILHPVSSEIQKVFQGTGMWNSATMDYDGWHYNHKHDQYFFSVDDSLLHMPTRILDDGRQANYLDVNHYARTCNAAFKNYLRDHYPAYLLEFLKKTGFLLIFPFSAIFHYDNRLWLDGVFNLSFHWLLLMLALLGFGFSFRQSKKFWIVWLLILYHLVLYGLTHIEARFNLTLVPALILLACFGAGSMVSCIKRLKAPIKRRLMFLFFQIILLSVIVFALDSMKADRPAVFYIQWGIASLIILASIGIVMMERPLARLRPGILTLGLVTLAYLTLYNLTDADRDEYRVRLHTDTEGILHRIRLGADLNPKRYEKAHLLIDMKLGEWRPEIRYHVHLNQRLIGVIGRDSARGLGLYYPEERKIPLIQQYWYNLEFDPGLLIPGRDNLITITADHPKESCPLMVYGDRSASANQYQGPGIFILESDKQAVLGVSRLMLKHSDPRIVQTYPLLSQSSRSFLIDQAGSLKQALLGSLRIRILLKTPGQYYIRRDFSNYLNIWYAYFGYFQLEENHDLIWSENDPGDEYQPINHNLHVYLASKDRLYYSGYDMY